MDALDRDQFPDPLQSFVPHARERLEVLDRVLWQSVPAKRRASSFNYQLEARDLHMLAQEITNTAPFASVVVAAVDRALLVQGDVLDERSGLLGEIGEKWYDGFNIATEAECPVGIKHVYGFLVDFAIHTHDRGVHFDVGDQDVGGRIALAQEITS